MSDHDLHDGLGEADDDLLARLRPPPPRTWRDRLDDLTSDPPPIGRVVAAVAVVAVVAVVALRVLAPPSPPPEVDLPLAQPAGSESAAPGGGDRAGADGAGGGPAGTAGGLDAGGGGTAASGSPATASATATEVVVHVVGAVAAPGVQRLPTGSRVVDAVEAAGGAAADADLARVNLAAVLVDGQQVVILRPGELPPSPVSPPPPSGTTSGAASDGGVVNVNTASAAELEELPGVGPATAEAIIAHRDEHGPFTSVDDLLDVRGIGEAKLEQLRDRAAV